MMKEIIIIHVFLFLLLLIVRTDAVIYKLSDQDYALMPPLMHFDNYEDCYLQPDALYCTVELTLVSDAPSPLLSMIQEYSAHRITHYNHSFLERGICVTRQCKKYYENTKEDLRWTLEACLNESFYNNYKLKTIVSDGYYCSKSDDNKEGNDLLRISVAAICAVIVCANIVGSFCDYFFEKEKKSTVLRLLCCFSMFRNWGELIAPPSNDPRFERLKAINGIRVVLMNFVVIGHICPFGTVIVPENPEFLNWVYATKALLAIVNGSAIMQMFMTISSFLLVYILLIDAEKTKPSWKLVPKYCLLRWLRLTPAYAIVLALTATCLGRITSGPFYKKITLQEMIACRSKWWQHLLYINNYENESRCMSYTWYLAADMQLYCIAVIVFMCCRTPRSRVVVLSLLFVVGVVLSTAHVYFQDLYGVLVLSPELVRNMFIGNATFDHVYKRGHTNLTAYVIGMSMGYLIYYCQKTGFNLKNYQQYRFLYWSVVPVAYLSLYSSTIYYDDGPPPPTHINLLFALLLKPLFSVILVILLTGVILELEDVYRPFLEWRGWTAPSRLSYSVYLVHVLVIYNCMASKRSTVTVTMPYVLQIVVTQSLMSFAAGFCLWMLVEAPASNLVKLIFGTKRSEAKKGIDEAPSNSRSTKIDEKTQ